MANRLTFNRDLDEWVCTCGESQVHIIGNPPRVICDECTAIHDLPPTSTTPDLKREWFEGTCGPECRSCRAFVAEKADLLRRLESYLDPDSFGVNVDQTGGHTMVVRIQFLTCRRPETRYVYLTDSVEYHGESGHDGYLACVYDDQIDGDEGVVLDLDASLDEVVRHLEAELTLQRPGR